MTARGDRCGWAWVTADGPSVNARLAPESASICPDAGVELGVGAGIVEDTRGGALPADDGNTRGG